MTDYTEFDNALLDAITTGAAVTASEMIGNHKMLCVMATQLAGEAAQKMPNAYASFGSVGRVFDRRLQSLRKRGLIRYAKGRWEVA